MYTFIEEMHLTQKRFTWTSYHHPSTQSWPTWPSTAIPGEGQNPDPYLEVLCNVPGVENVRIAHRVEDVKQAAYIIRKFYYLLCLLEPATPIKSYTDIKGVVIYTCGGDNDPSGYPLTPYTYF